MLTNLEHRGLARVQEFDALKKNRGRPKVADPKIFTAIRLDADLVDAFKSTGKGWQTRAAALLAAHAPIETATDTGI